MIFALLVFGVPFKKAPRHMPLEARLMFKKKPRPENLLPEKMPAPKPAIKTPPEEKAPTKAVAKEETRPLKANDKKAPTKIIDYKKQLARLSKSFSEELNEAVSAKEEAIEIEADESYFDQIYSLIKRSFVVPPHVNNPRGRNLRAVLKLFLFPDGSLSRLLLEHSSGDESFDKAVMDGTRRVSNFGAVPILLQSALSKNGVLIEMCPFKCPEK